ncbi:metallophosphoesterase [Natronosporangium hydrolyticum]|uniref:Metallophosphoesterase n=1 Tax=Natronosporangium hydrolyticum TaxID=2811111 RepID=A0A895YBP0_9ACTN|nr:metallophosphoesterase [Natronosporangium hydrolyticum]QSB13642.1 metallophosphoesterase [Natronosporangium hydrolyticum]
MSDVTDSTDGPLGEQPEPAGRRWLRRSRAALEAVARPDRRVVAGALVLLVAIVGSVLGVLLGARTGVEVGPFNAELRVTPSVNGETSVLIPPLGSLHVDTHDGPAHLTLQLGSLDQARTQVMIDDPGGVTRAVETVADDVMDGVIQLGFGTLGAAVLGSMVLAALVFRDTRRVAWAGGVSLALVLSSFGTAAATLRPDAIEEPRFEGLLINAPALIGDVQQIADDYQRYTDNLQSMVENVSTLYTAASTLEAFQPDDSMTRVLHVADLHLNPAAWPVMRTVVEQYGIDFIIDCGDIVDWGTGPESQYLDSIRLMGVPYVFVRGNHDSQLTQEAVAAQPNAIVLDDDITTVSGITVAGIGDPRFTPDQRTGPFSEEELAAVRQEVTDSGGVLADTILAYDEPVQIAAVHDPVAAELLDGVVPTVLAGHAHSRWVGPVVEWPVAEEPPPLEPGQTRLMVQGSTGGAGLRGLEGEHPDPLALTVLYYNDEQQLAAYDDISIGGHGLSEASVQRHQVPVPGGDAPAADDEAPAGEAPDDEAATGEEPAPTGPAD